MKGAALAAILATLSGCEMMVKHPAPTIGIVGGVIAEGSCELATDEHLTCAGISVGTAIALAGIVWLAMLVGGKGDTVLGPDPDDIPPNVPQDPTLDLPDKPAPDPNVPGVPAEPPPAPTP